MKVLIVPIGIESKTGGQYAPILDDGRFLFIPIPEFSIENPKHKEKIAELKIFHKNVYKTSYDFKTYNEIKIDPWPEFPNRRHMGDYLGDGKYRGYPLTSYIPHYDPEFNTFTYGEGSEAKAKALSKLDKGDMLVFCMSLIPAFRSRAKGKYLVGYITIEKIFNFRFNGQNLDYSKIDKRICYNMHIIRKDKSPVIAVGKPNESRLFKKAIQLTDNKKWNILPDILKQIDWPYKTSIVHMGLKKLMGDYAKKFCEFVYSYDDDE